jgi:hypothetical protein
VDIVNKYFHVQQNVFYCTSAHFSLEYEKTLVLSMMARTLSGFKVCRFGENTEQVNRDKTKVIELFVVLCITIHKIKGW